MHHSETQKPRLLPMATKKDSVTLQSRSPYDMASLLQDSSKEKLLFHIGMSVANCVSGIQLNPKRKRTPLHETHCKTIE